MTWANKYIGIPYVILGRDASGLDCYGLIRHVMAQEFNVTMPLLTTDGARSPRALTREFLILRRSFVQVEKAQEGDIIIFKPMNQPTHVAIAIGIDSYFLHTEPMKNACIESWKSPMWINLLDSVWRHKSKCHE